MTYPYSIKHGKIANDNRFSSTLLKRVKVKKRESPTQMSANFWYLQMTHMLLMCFHLQMIHMVVMCFHILVFLLHSIVGHGCGNIQTPHFLANLNQPLCNLNHIRVACIYLLNKLQPRVHNPGHIKQKAITKSSLPHITAYNIYSCNSRSHDYTTKHFHNIQPRLYNNIPKIFMKKMQPRAHSTIFKDVHDIQSNYKTTLCA